MMVEDNVNDGDLNENDIEAGAMLPVLTVSELNKSARRLVEGEFTSIRLIGEVSNLNQPSSGHLYFSLKDAKAQIRCAFFRHMQHSLRFALQVGQQVLVHAKVSIYEARGDYQLIIQSIELAGDGALQVAFEALKKRLHAEGLFDAAHKQQFPRIPRCIGVVTSASAAALRDVLRVLGRRFPAIPVVIYPSNVQGEQAKYQIVEALRVANERKECDVIILARGGGSLEDLWTFNEESVARAIFASQIPIVTGIGHEVDFSIADFVADRRCATPSAAAEWVSPEQAECRQTLRNHQEALSHAMRAKLSHLVSEVHHLSKRLKHPRDSIQQKMQATDRHERRLRLAMEHLLNTYSNRMRSLASRLEAISPLNTLSRGYAIVTRQDQVITTVRDINVGDNLTVKFRCGRVTCSVEEVYEAELD